jgi:type III secretion system chaperone SycN
VRRAGGMSMGFCTAAVAQFCRDLGVAPAQPQEPLLRLELPGAGVLQLERLAGQLTLWLDFSVHGAMFERAMRCALRQVYEHQACGCLLRCGLLANDHLVLLAGLDEHGLTEQALHRAYRLLTRVRTEVLAA